MKWCELEDGRVEVLGGRVLPEWIDFNGHMNVAYYVLAFDQVVDMLFDRVGLDHAYRTRTGRSMFAAEAHITWQRELHRDDPLRYELHFLAFDDKRLHSLYRMFHAESGVQAATMEWMQLSVDLESRRVVPWDEVVRPQVQALCRLQAQRPPPPEVGRVMTVSKPA